MTKPNYCSHLDWPCCGCGDLRDEEEHYQEMLEAEQDAAQAEYEDFMEDMMYDPEEDYDSDIQDMHFEEQQWPTLMEE